MNIPASFRNTMLLSALPTVIVEGAEFTIRSVNPAFCALTGGSEPHLVGRGFRTLITAGKECMEVLERVYFTGEAASYAGPISPRLHWTICLWPIAEGDKRAQVLIQVADSQPLQHNLTAMNEALLISSLQQHELREAAETLRARVELSETRYRGLIEAAPDCLDSNARRPPGFRQFQMG